MVYSLSNDTWDEREAEAAHKVIDSKLFTMRKNSQINLEQSMR